MKTVNIVGCGRVGQTLGRLPHMTGQFDIQDLMASSSSSALKAADFIGAGRATLSLEEMRDADIWMLTVPDTKIVEAADSLAAVLSWRDPAQHGSIVVFHCSGFLPASTMSPLKQAGCLLASVHPILNFASPETGVTQFKGTPCGMEGDIAALEILMPIMHAIGAVCFSVHTNSKPLYHAAAVFASNFQVVLQAIAEKAWTSSGVPVHLVPKVQAALLEATASNIVSLGPVKAITGPAARGDSVVVALQGAAVAQWQFEAGVLYKQMSMMARCLATTGIPFSERPNEAKSTTELA
jgi:predicted short-subunit dehydrogenase-like oxidoreductase (DUF2520 family)